MSSEESTVLFRDKTGTKDARLSLLERIEDVIKDDMNVGDVIEHLEAIRLDIDVYCPDCRTRMVRSRWERNDGTYSFGWLCECDEDTRAYLSRHLIAYA